MSLLTNETINHILDRRSIRSYKPEAIPADVVETLLTAAVHAPTARNSQPWQFIAGFLLVRHPRHSRPVRGIRPGVRPAGRGSGLFGHCPGIPQRGKATGGRPAETRDHPPQQLVTRAWCRNRLPAPLFLPVCMRKEALQ